MKNIIQLLTIMILTTQTTYAASPKKITKQVNKQIEWINHLENTNDIKGAFQSSIQLQQYLESVLQINQIVVSVESKLNEIYQEKVTSRTSAGFSLFGLFLSGGGEYNTQSTGMFAQNYDETNNFSSKKQKDLMQLKSDLKSYVHSNIDGIALYKLVTLKVLDLALQSNFTDLKYLEKLAQLNAKISFNGVQKVTHCVQNNYIDQTTSASAGFSLLGLIGASTHYESTTYAKTTKSCQSTFNQLNNDNDSVVLLSLNHIDEEIQKKKQIVFINALNQTKADYFPTFDSPYYK